MSKRSAEERIERYQRKLRKLEENENLRRLQALETQLSSNPTGNNVQNPLVRGSNENKALSRHNLTSGEDHPTPDPTPSNPRPAGNTPDPTPLQPGPTQTPVSTQEVPNPIPPVTTPDFTSVPIEPENEPAPAVSESDPTQENSLIPELDPDLLLALGDASDDIPKFGPNIHPNLAERWLPILKKGLSKECKDKLIKEYVIPENCPLLHAPKLNPEISAATTDMVRNRDKKMEATQQQLGVGLSAINKALSMLLMGEEKLSVIKHLSDGCRILSDLHYLESQTRIKLVTPGLAKPFLNIIQDNERDETLFGSKLPEKIKASKAIEKQGLQIKKHINNPRSTTAASSSSTASRASQYQGNWQSSPRYPLNRGGRGVPRKITGAVRRPAPPPQSRSAGQNKSRVAAPHQ